MLGRLARGLILPFVPSFFMVMKTISIKITVPQKKDKWKIQIGRSVYKRSDAVIAYNLVERKVKRFLASPSDTKTSLTVDYGVLYPLEPNDWKNEGCYTLVNEMLYALSCFLEDHVNKGFLTSKRKSYL